MNQKSLFGLIFTAGVVLVVWSFWPTLMAAADRWANDAQYSHGWLVPLFSVYLLWHNRKYMPSGFRASWWGLVLLALGLGIRAFGVMKNYSILDSLALIPMLLGLALVTGGWAAVRWSGAASLFVIFMIPLPFRLQTLMSTQLQSLATQMSTFALQTLGAPAVSEGNVIVIGDTHIGIVDACSGLGMIMTFAALAAGIAILVQTSWWVKGVLFASAMPVALVANVIRISATGLLYHWDYNEEARKFYHDLAGYIMIPMGIMMLLAEFWILERLIVRSTPTAVDDRPLFLPSMSPLPRT